METPGTIDCREHGPQHEAYVCGHLGSDSILGFNAGPATNSWMDESSRAAQIKLVCASCYICIWLANQKGKRSAGPSVDSN